MENFLKNVKDHFKNTPLNKLQGDWNEINSLDINGPLVSEYLEYINNSCYIFDDPPNQAQIEIESKAALDFPGSFFLPMIVYEIN